MTKTIRTLTPDEIDFVSGAGGGNAIHGPSQVPPGIVAKLDLSLQVDRNNVSLIWAPGNHGDIIVLQNSGSIG